MKAAICTAFGDPGVVEVGYRERPAPGRGEVLVRVRSAGMNPIDGKIRSGRFRFVFWMSPPFVAGFDFAGEVADAGDGLAGLHIGDVVFGSVRRPGTHAEYAAVPADLTIPIPPGVSPDEAAAAPGSGLTALLALRDRLQLRPGEEVLLNGASGGVGSFAVQIAKMLGARVTAVASADNHDLLRELGADECIDYRQEDFADREEAFDAIFDIVPNRSFPECRHALKPGGRYLTTIPGPGPLAWKAITATGLAFGGRRAEFVILKPTRGLLLELSELLAGGAVRSVVTRVLPLDHAVEAHERMDTGHTAGKIVLRMPD
jgi:NADPH:quinone reductase-like Zn-dependent oxidoreductase